MYVTKKQALLAKASTVPGASNAIEAYDLDFKFATSILARDNATKRSFGSMPHAIAMRYGVVTFKTPLRVSGSPSGGTQELEKPLWEACGFTMANAASDTTIVCAADMNGSSLDAYLKFYHDGLMRALTSCRGRINRISAPVGELGWIEWEFWGILTDDGSAEAIPADIEDYFPTTKHQPVHGATYTIGGSTYTVRRTEIKLASELVITKKHTDTSHGGIGTPTLVDRPEDGWAGEVQIEEPAIGTKDFYADVLINNPAIAQMIIYIGSGADLVTQLTINMQWDSIKNQSEQKIQDLVLPFRLRETAGNINNQFSAILT